MHKGPITCVLASQDGRQVFTGGYDKAVFAWDRERGTSRLLGTHDHLVNALALSQNGKWLASSSSDYTIHVYDLEKGTRARVLYAHADDVEALSFAADDTLLVSTSRDRRGLVWNLATGAVEREFHGHSKDVLSLWIEGDRAFTTGDDGRALIWNIRTGELLGEIGPFECELDAVSGSAQANLFCVGADDGRVLFYDATDWTLRHAIQAHERGVKRVAFSPSGKQVLTAGYDHRIKIWSLDTFELAYELPAYKYQWERSLSWSSDEKSILGASFGVRFCEWDLEQGKLVSPAWELATPALNDLALSDGLAIATASDDGRFRIDGQDLGMADGTLTNGVGISADGRFALWGDHASCVHLMDRQAGNRILTITLGTGPINSIFYNRSDARFYVGTYGGFIHIVDPQTARDLQAWRAHEGAVKAVAADERHVLSCAADGTIHLFNKENVEEVREFRGPTAIVNDISLDSQRGRVISVSRDKVVRVYDMATGAVAAQHDVHRYSIKSVTVTEDGTVFSGDYWGHLVIWKPGEEPSAAVRIAQNGISALRTHERDVYACSYEGGVYRIQMKGHVEEVLRLFDQSQIETIAVNSKGELENHVRA